jgi:pseudaminic acid biosynthesis-associated methylase
MDKIHKTEQEEFWAGDFGNDYINRNQDEIVVAHNLAFFSKALRHTIGLNSIVEFGANIGMNLRAIKLLYPNINSKAIEINPEAALRLRKTIGEDNVFEGSIYNYLSSDTYTISLIKTVLIHINPNMLPLVYDKLYHASNKYILICEYYNPTPVSVNYRGHEEKLFKRDFAGEMLDKFPDLKLVDYGFAYHRDNDFPQDDLNWFLLQKN